MLGKRSDQRGLWEADHLYLDLVGRDSFCGRLAGLRGQLFLDEDFAALYARYLAASLKGTAEIDWDEPTAGEAFLAEMEDDAGRPGCLCSRQSGPGTASCPCMTPKCATGARAEASVLTATRPPSP